MPDAVVHSIADAAGMFAGVHLNEHYLPTRKKKSLVSYAGEVATLMSESRCGDVSTALGWVCVVRDYSDTPMRDITKALGPSIARMSDRVADTPYFRDSGSSEIMLKKFDHAERLRNACNLVQEARLAEQIVGMRLLADDPPILWNVNARLGYLKGCFQVSLACRVANPRLDVVFHRVYEKALSLATIP